MVAPNGPHCTASTIPWISATGTVMLVSRDSDSRSPPTGSPPWVWPSQVASHWVAAVTGNPSGWPTDARANSTVQPVEFAAPGLHCRRATSGGHSAEPLAEDTESPPVLAVTSAFNGLYAISTTMIWDRSS